MKITIEVDPSGSQAPTVRQAEAGDPSGQVANTGPARDAGPAPVAGVPTAPVPKPAAADGTLPVHDGGPAPSPGSVSPATPSPTTPSSLPAGAIDAGAAPAR